MTPLKLAYGGTAILALLLVFASRSEPPPVPPPIPSAAAEPDDFTVRWLDAMKPLALVSMQIVLPPSAPDPAPEIPVERVMLPQVVEPTEENAIDLQADKVPWRRIVESRQLDRGDLLCERHHMHKVVTANGKSWRCRK